MVADTKGGYPSEFDAMKSVAAKLGIGSVDTLRKWVRRSEVDAGRPGITSEEAAQIKALKKENTELRRANEILKAASFLRVNATVGTARPGFALFFAAWSV